jgi:hypothetical protein
MIGGWLFCGLFLAIQSWWFLGLCLGLFTFLAVASSHWITGKEALYPPMVVAAFVGGCPPGVGQPLGGTGGAVPSPRLSCRSWAGAGSAAHAAATFRHPPLPLPAVCVNFPTPQAAIAGTIVKTCGIASGCLVGGAWGAAEGGAG